MSASLELLNVQTNTVITFPPNRSIVIIGKPGGDKPSDIDVSALPDSDIVSRNHAQIWVNSDEYHITDLSSSNGTYVNGVKLQPQVFCPLKPGDKISLGQGDKITFMFRVKGSAATSTKNSTPNTAPPNVAQTQINPPATLGDEEFHATILTKLVGLAMMIGGLCFLAANIAIGGILNAPLVIPSVFGILILIYGGQIRILGWVLIAIGVALAIGTGTIFLAPISLLTFTGSSFLLFSRISIIHNWKDFRF